MTEPLPSSPERFVGWFRIAASEAVPRGGVATLRLAGRDLVLFRDEAGRIAATDPHCPHLGAHLGHGGTVVDGALRCPFHGFRFGLDGRCTRVDYSRTIPNRARLEPYAVRETAGQIFVFDGPRPLTPTFDLPDLDDPGITPTLWTTLGFDGAVEDFAENGVDLGHFAAVHAYSNVRDVRIVHDGPRIHTRFRFDRENPVLPLPKRITSVFDTVIHGLGCSVTELHIETLDLRMRLVLLATQTEAKRVDFTVGASARLPPRLRGVPPALVGRLVAPALRLFLGRVEGDIAQDREIWEHRIRLAHPALVPEDREVARFRQYLDQFRGADPGTDARA